jgi:hypothetical protein
VLGEVWDPVPVDVWLVPVLVFEAVVVGFAVPERGTSTPAMTYRRES